MAQIIDMLSVLSADEFKYLKFFEYKTNDIIHFQDDECKGIDILVHGEIKMSNIDINGNETTFNYLNAPNIFGNNLIFSTSKKYMGDVIAMSNVSLYRIDQDGLLFLLKSNDKFLKLYLMIIANKSIELSSRLRIMAINNTYKRVYSYILFRIDSNNGVYNVKSITNLASELSLPRETVSRIVSKLVREEKITYTNKQFKTVKNALEWL